MSRRINARIDDELAQQLAELCRRTGRTLTEVIEEALRDWSRDQQARSTAAELFTANGFIASGVGPSDLARDAKRHLTESLKSKS